MLQPKPAQPPKPRHPMRWMPPRMPPASSPTDPESRRAPPSGEDDRAHCEDPDMKTAEIARRYLDYFEKNGHTIVPSASLVTDDPALLFTVAGMVPFIPFLSGNVPPPYARAADVQKCIRTNDIEEVGKTPRHGTFFQMLGNWSFGDYFKEGAITYAWDLL